MPTDAGSSARLPAPRAGGGDPVAQEGVQPVAHGDDLVLARRLLSAEAAAELAEWCGGTVIPDDPLVEGSPPLGVRVPGADRSAVAVAGDWVVRRADGSCEALSHEDFVARHVPVPRQEQPAVAPNV